MANMRIAVKIEGEQELRQLVQTFAQLRTEAAKAAAPVQEKAQLESPPSDELEKEVAAVTKQLKADGAGQVQ